MSYTTAAIAVAIAVILFIVAIVGYVTNHSTATGTPNWVWVALGAAVLFLIAGLILYHYSESDDETTTHHYMSTSSMVQPPGVLGVPGETATTTEVHHIHHYPKTNP